MDSMYAFFTVYWFATGCSPGAITFDIDLHNKLTNWFEELPTNKQGAKYGNT